jgi:ketosteroid isomerase-like protein
VSRAERFLGPARFAGTFLAVGIMLLSTNQSVMAQTPTPAMVESWVKGWVAAWTSNDAEAVARADPTAKGFGFRDFQYRPDNRPLAARIDAIKSFFATKEYYRVELNELHTEVDGNIGLAWGFHTEDFKEKGRNPEKVRVRFSYTLKYEGNGWRTLLYHREAQKFDEQGRYVREQ